MSNTVQVTFTIKPDVEREDFIDIIKDLTFQEGLCVLGDVVESLEFEGDPTIHLNA